MWQIREVEKRRRVAAVAIVQVCGLKGVRERSIGRLIISTNRNICDDSKQDTGTASSPCFLETALTDVAEGVKVAMINILED